MKTAPFKRSYWVVPNRLLAGCYPSGQTPDSAAAKINGLIKAGVTDIVCLMETTETNHDGKPFQDYMPPAYEAAAAVGRELRWSRHPIVDGAITTRDTMIAILNTIDEAIARGGIVYVHCWGGRGRTGTVIGCWLIRHRLVPPDRSVEKLHALIGEKIEEFHPTPETRMQIAFVENWRPGQ